MFLFKRVYEVYQSRFESDWYIFKLNVIMSLIICIFSFIWFILGEKITFITQFSFFILFTVSFSLDLLFKKDFFFKFSVLYGGMLYLFFFSIKDFRVYPMFKIWLLAPFCYSSLINKSKILNIVLLILSIFVSNYLEDLNRIIFIESGFKKFNVLPYNIYIDFFQILVFVFILFFLIHGYQKTLLNEQVNLIENKKQLVKANKYIAQTLKIKENFYNQLTHEIRTPMNAIIGGASILNNSALTSNAKEMVSSLKVIANNLLSLIDEMIEYSKVDKLNYENPILKINLKKEIIGLSNSYYFLAKKNNSILSYEIDSNISENLIGNKIKLNQILVNLISNSIKFTHNGTIKIKTTLLKDKEKSQRILIEIIDTGIGMSENFQKKIFEKFTKEESEQSNLYNANGAGIGLYLVKNFVDKIKGKIFLESKEGVGTKVNIELEFEKLDFDNSVFEIDKNDQNLDKELTVLVVEDNFANRFIIRKILENYKMNVLEAENGKEGVDILSANHVIDLVLMDVSMPVMDGIEASRYIRQNLNLNIPIIVLSAHAVKEYMEKCFEVGINDYLLKPINENVLIPKIFLNVNTK